MTYYKVIYKKRVIDVLAGLKYVKYQLKHQILLLCPVEEAEGVLSSDCETAYHTYDVPKNFPVDIFPTVTLEEITEIEYKRLVRNHLMSPEEIIDDYTQSLLEAGIL